MIGYYGFPGPVVLTPEQTRNLANARTRNASDGLVEPARELNVPQPAPTVAVPSLDAVDRGRLLNAALRARRAIPGPIGALVADHCTTWAEFGWRFGGDSSIAKLVAAVMAIPVDDLPSAA